ncbi:hypothetical protein [Scytonema sp. NUACC26]|uniref:hypothetical protein n=1 Tax=Scytonema sp. NUACC26 TaxID=3140176 RepID=UPI0038B2D465
MGKWRFKFDNWVKSLPEKKRVLSTGRTLLINAAEVPTLKMLISLVPNLEVPTPKVPTSLVLI